MSAPTCPRPCNNHGGKLIARVMNGMYVWYCYSCAYWTDRTPTWRERLFGP